MTSEQYAAFLKGILLPTSGCHVSHHVRKKIKRVIGFSRPTEFAGTARAAASWMLERYRVSDNPKWLEQYVRMVPQGYHDEHDFAVDTIDGDMRPTLQKGCVQCGVRKPSKSFVAIEKQPNGTTKLRPSHYCAECRERQKTKKWWMVLADDADTGEAFIARHTGTHADGRRGARLPKTA